MSVPQKSVFSAVVAALVGGLAFGDAAPVKAAQLLEPKGSVESGKVTFRWKPDKGETQYLYRVRTKNGVNVTASKGSLKAFSCNSKDCTKVFSGLDAGDYSWQVRSWKGGSRQDWSKAVSFSVKSGGSSGSGGGGGSSGGSDGEMQPAIVSGDYRLAFDVDGNYWDPDDWAATPMSIALFAKAKIHDKMVHYGYSCSLEPANDPNMRRTMKTSTVEAADWFNVPRNKLVECVFNNDYAVKSLAGHINKATAKQPLYIIAAGPMERVYRSVKAANPSARKHVTVISHSPWNDNRVDPPSLTHTKSDVIKLGVNWIQIQPQHRLFTQTDRCEWRVCEDPEAWEPWTWLKNAKHTRMRWVYQRMVVSRKPDVSDAGMVYYFLTGDDAPTPAKLRKFFGIWIG
ncbi:MAG: hypothetical protein AAFY56_15075 [Pseudomonadota bacterium]